MIAVAVPLVAYLIGSIPFGYLIARMKGVNLFQVGSGNIGATNVGRVLGKKYGILVFLLDFAKGAAPVAFTNQLTWMGFPEWQTALGSPDAMCVAVALAAFVGHLFPIYLGFRGGKGVATGAGVISVLVPGPAAIAISTWAAVTAATRWVSLGSILAVVALVVARLIGTEDPFGDHSRILTLFCIAGTILVVLKHRANIRRLWNGTESQLTESVMWDRIGRMIHLLAIGMWFGSSIFFNLLAAPAIFESFKQAVASAPSDRTAYVAINKDLDEEQQKALSSALAGTAVGPLFPIYFSFQGVCIVLAMITAWSWHRVGKVHRWRLILLNLALIVLMISWPLSQHVSQLRLDRFASDLAVAAAAKEKFGSMHAISLLLSLIQTLLATVLMALAGLLPLDKSQQRTASSRSE